MKLIYSVLIGLFFNLNCHAEALRFESPITVTAASKGVFIHLDASGRRSLAMSNQVIAVVWEDNRSGKPSIYMAYRIPGSSGFSKAVQVSGGSAAYEPVIAGLSGKRFLVGWEEDDNVWLRVVGSASKGKAIKLTKAVAKQISLAADNSGKIAAVWVQGQTKKPNNQSSIYYADIDVKEYDIHVAAPYLVDTSKGNHKQLYPVIEFTQDSRVVVWEDRRHGHTRIFTAFALNHEPFQPHHLLNEFSPSPNPKFGKGSGAMRPVLASDGNRSLVAAWMDKRNWRSGYDVYTAFSTNGGKDFGKNEKAQDMFAEDIPQWHASVALRKPDGIAAVAWDDTRNDTPDVFYSLRAHDGWSDDYELPGASGPGRQTHPSIVFDQDGILHAVWLDNAAGQLKLLYIHSK